jgi:hypothetical protein
MTDKLEPLILDLVTWCAAGPRRYADVIDAWRTSCPRLMVWEEAHDRGLVETRPGPDGLIVVVTAAGDAAAAVRMPRPGKVEAPAVAWRA